MKQTTQYHGIHAAVACARTSRPLSTTAMWLGLASIDTFDFATKANRQRPKEALT